MPVPAVIISTIRVAGAVYTSVKLAKAAIDALSTASGKDYWDPLGHQTCRFVNRDPDECVGIIGGYWTMRSQEFPESPRGQLAAGFSLVLNRAEAQGQGPIMAVSVQVTPQWWDANAKAWIELPAGTVDAKIPLGASTLQGGIHIDAEQAFSRVGDQSFMLAFEILNPNVAASWSFNTHTFWSENDIAAEAHRTLRGNFDYFHTWFD